MPFTCAPLSMSWPVEAACVFVFEEAIYTWSSLGLYVRVFACPRNSTEMHCWGTRAALNQSHHPWALLLCVLYDRSCLCGWFLCSQATTARKTCDSVSSSCLKLQSVFFPLGLLVALFKAHLLHIFWICTKGLCANENQHICNVLFVFFRANDSQISFCTSLYFLLSATLKLLQLPLIEVTPGPPHVASP